MRKHAERVLWVLQHMLSHTSIYLVKRMLFNSKDFLLIIYTHSMALNLVFNNVLTPRVTTWSGFDYFTVNETQTIGP